MKRYILLTGIVLSGFCVSGQQMPSYNQFFSNRALYNPSFIGQSGYTEFNINHRQQWMGIDGAPVTTNVNFQTPVSDKFALGVILYSDKLGLISKYEATAGLSYKVDINSNSSLRFGLTAGAGRNDIEYINDDPAYANALDNSFYFSGQFGVNYNYKRFTLGFSLPQLMESEFAQEKNFEELGLKATQLTFTTASYQFDLTSKITLEPTLFYQSDSETIDQWGALAMVTYNDLFWVGGGYRQEQGANGFLGFNVNNMISVGYAYEFAPAAVASELSNGTHEFQLGIKLGKKRNKKDVIVNNESPVILEPQVTQEVEPDEEKDIEQPKTKNRNRKEESRKSEIEAYFDKDEEKTQPEEKTNETEEIEASNDELKEDEIEPVKVREPKPGELAPGYYVIVGAYENPQNADAYIRQVKGSGYGVTRGLYPETGLNYVYIKRSDDFNSALKVRNEIRKIFEFEFREAWILHVK